MGRLLDAIAKRLGYVRPSTQVRRFDAAKQSRLTADWILRSSTVDVDLRRDLGRMRERSRDLNFNNPYVRKFGKMLRKNVPGPRGIRLQMDVRDDNRARDVAANRMIERAWGDWGKKGVCTVCGQYSWQQVQETVVGDAGRDGEILVRKVLGFDNDFGFALQLIPAEHLDHELNRPAREGVNEIRLGVEFNAWGRPVAYHLLRRNPGDSAIFGAAWPAATDRHIAVPADEILHFHYKDQVRQSRGVPLIVAAVIRLRMQGGYEEAALVAARAGAMKMGFFEEEIAEGMEKPRTAAGDMIDEASPGHFERLPPGISFKQFDPGYPDGDFAPFEKAMLKGTASAIDVSYPTLGSDLEGVNFSSLRSGLNDERDGWRMLQAHQVLELNQPVFDVWLPQALIMRQVNLPFSRIQKFRAATWRPRGWDWVNPLQESQAHALDLKNGLTSRTRILAARGEDLEETFQQLKEEQELAEALELELEGVDEKLLLGNQATTEQGDEA